MKTKRKPGRPPKIKSAEALQKKIEQYFTWCEGSPLTDPNTGRPIFTKHGIPVYKDVHPPTMAGLANALGISRPTLLSYSGKKVFENIIDDAKRRVEQYAEERLFDKDGSAGARFSLQNNFDDWKDEKEISISAAEDDDIIAEVRRRMAEAAIEAPETL